MCSACAMAAAAGASGIRSWLQAHDLMWLTPARLRGATIALFVAAFGISAIGLAGSTPPRPHPAPHASIASAAH